MAKTNCPSIAGPSSPTQPLRSRRRRSPPCIVAFLATISASPFSANAHPLDPPQTALPFLYPPFIHQPTPSVAKRFLPSSSDATTSTPPPVPPTQCDQERSNLPDNSSQCPGSCPPSAVQDADARNGPTVTLLPSSTSVDEFDVSSLPTGWNTPNNASRQGTVIILSLSVALAVIILAMMLACVVWRRKLIPKKDPEKKWRQSSDFVEDDASRSIREAKAAQRRWTNAVSRWRNNVRFSARRRRTDRAIARTSSYSTLGQGEGIGTERENTPSSSRSPSPTLTMRSRVSTSQDVPLSSAASVHSATSQARAESSRASSPQPQVTSPYSLPPHPASPIQPPAYHPQPPVPPSPSTGDHSPPYTHSDCCSPSSSKPPLSSSSPHQLDDGDDQLDSLSGHVATDDKAILSRRAAFVSAPPGSSSHFPPSVSVPSMEDDDDFEFPSDSRPSSPVHDAYSSEERPPYLPPSSLLPPPPSKGKLKYDYSRDLDLDLNYDIATVEPALGPSAPPFEETEAVPSAPPFDLAVPVASAPVLAAEREDDRHGDTHRMDAGAVMTSPGHVSSIFPEEHVVYGATPDTVPPLPRR
ncbi:hypothetical protein EDB92DRAFT_567259 [Lactarius akahatsu]|uniref:Uncharacterized protein n=1 Tax=Lactarius akahatsu TaxID=416441 RepID=A0AAD4LI33_9AGAM|nr:hypothetical protein EDB92DRAFT_567259 [Lactarius akahatsu]